MPPATALNSERAPTLRHEAFFYTTQHDFISTTSEFVHKGVRAGHPVFVALSEPNLSLLRGTVGRAAASVDFFEMSRLGGNPSRIIPAMATFLAEHGANGTHSNGTRVHAIGEPIWSSRSPRELRECVRHEALINHAFADAALWWICPYDVSDLPDDVLEEAWRTHPLVSDGKATLPSGRYAQPLSIAGLDEPLPDPVGSVTTAPVEAGSLVGLRAFLRREATDAGLPAVRGEDLTLAVNEIVTNVLRHGRSGGAGHSGSGHSGSGHGDAGRLGELRLWRDGGSLVCEVTGPGELSDPLAGRHPPDPAAEMGRGIWLVHQLCDLVELRSGAGVTVVRMHVRRPAR